MDEIAKCTMELQEAIRRSRVYADYEKAREELNRNPELKRRVDEFRSLNFTLQNTSENIDFYSEIEKLEQQSCQLRKNPEANDFLEKELALCRMVQRIGEGLVSVIDIEIGGFEEVIF